MSFHGRCPLIRGASHHRYHCTVLVSLCFEYAHVLQFASNWLNSFLWVFLQDFVDGCGLYIHLVKNETFFVRDIDSVSYYNINVYEFMVVNHVNEFEMNCLCLRIVYV
eukprot:GHVL01021630.1.p1 GENE.GHVL01021630.1~~GHVL01021630.1.p1  ORF type:complete len:108 (+),score=7.05 GHVL01021630.1:196-519(+)